MCVYKVDHQTITYRMDLLYLIEKIESGAGRAQDLAFPRLSLHLHKARTPAPYVLQGHCGPKETVYVPAFCQPHTGNKHQLSYR